MRNYPCLAGLCPRVRLPLVACLLALLVAPPAHAQSDVRLANAAIRIDVDSDGLIGLGTVAGSPDSALDDGKRLMFGWDKDNALSSTSFSSVRISDTAGIADFSLAALVESAPTTRVGDAIHTEWTISGTVRVRQSLTIMNNPFSARQDLMRLEYTVSNIGAAPTSVGVRAMLDVMVGSNDAAPYFVSGRPRTNLQQAFVAPNIPPYYVSFESNDFASDSLKGLGLLSGYGLTTPDRLQIANWRELATKGVIVPWEHEVAPDQPHGDSAIVAYWLPRALQPGQSYSVATAYGLAGQGGGAMWLIAPVLVAPGTSSVTVNGWVNNTSTEDYGSGAITLTLPAGMSFESGSQASRAITGVLAGQSSQTTWRVRIDAPDAVGVYTYTAGAGFVNVTSPLSATARTIVSKVNRLMLPIVAR
jgi:hypothetical protein